MKKLLPKATFFLTLMLSVSLPIAAENSSVLQLSKDATISLVTQWPGSEIYLAFGHSAFRVKDPVRGIDELYNYGVFSLDDPLFLARFAYGQLDYLLGIFPFDSDLRYDAKTQNRIWHEQVLNLDPEQVQNVYQFLAINALPENRTYRYNIILDNCSTRIRDVLEKVLGSSIHFAAQDQKSEGKSYRQMIDEYIGNRPFYQFFIYLGLGTAVDHKVNAREAMWLPQYLMEAFDNAKIEKNGQAASLVSAENRLFTPPHPSEYDETAYNPAYVLWPLATLILFISLWVLLKHKGTVNLKPQKVIFRMGDWFLFFVVGLIGCIIAYLTFVSSHTACKGNLNLVWLLPTHIIVAFFVLFKARFRWMRWYFLVSAIASIAPAILWPIWPQGMHPTMIAPMLILSVRSFSQFVRLKASA